MAPASSWASDQIQATALTYTAETNWIINQLYHIGSSLLVDLPFCLFVFCFVLLFRATPVAYEGSQARGLIELLAAGLVTATAMPDPSHICDLHHSSQQHRIPSPLSKARARTHNLMVPSHFFCATMGTPVIILNSFDCFKISLFHLFFSFFLNYSSLTILC